MANTPLSTLSEIHRAVVDMISNNLLTNYPIYWTNASQVFYCPVTGWDNAITQYFKVNKTNQVTYPFTVVTGSTSMITNNDYTRRTWTSEYSTQDDNKSTWLLYPMKMNYTITTYAPTLEICEMLRENAIIDRGKVVTWDYDSVLINTKLYIQVIYNDLPSYDLISSTDDKYKSKGAIYAFTHNVQVNGIIGRYQESVKITDPQLNIQIDPIKGHIHRF